MSAHAAVSCTPAGPKHRLLTAQVVARTGSGWPRPLLRAGNVLVMPEPGIDVPTDGVYVGLDLHPGRA